MTLFSDRRGLHTYSKSNEVHAEENPSVDEIWPSAFNFNLREYSYCKRAVVTKPQLLLLIDSITYQPGKLHA